MGAATAATYAWYIRAVFGRAEHAPFIKTPYTATLLWTMCAMLVVVVAVVAHIVVAIADADQQDQRDQQIDQFGEYVGMCVVVVGAMTGLGMAMINLDHFWIANIIYLALVLSTSLASAAKILACRRGFHQW